MHLVNWEVSSQVKGAGITGHTEFLVISHV